MSDINQGLTLDELNRTKKILDFNNIRREFQYDIFNKIKYIAIRKIPIIFIIFLLITLFLITINSGYIEDEYYIILLDKITYLMMGITIIIANVYLSTLREEYMYKINTMWDFRKEINDFIDTKNNKKFLNELVDDNINNNTKENKTVNFDIYVKEYNMNIRNQQNRNKAYEKDIDII